MESIQFLAANGCATNLALFVVGSLFVGFYGSPLFVWTIWSLGFWAMAGTSTTLLAVAAGVFLIFNIKPIRALIVSNIVLKTLKALNFLPAISETERIALEAGATWVDGELFSGKPDFSKVRSQRYGGLTKEEQAFLDGPVNKLCSMVTDWEISNHGDLPAAVWDYLKKEKFFGMIIPKAYGGLEFSALMHSEVISQVSSRSVALGVTVMVPNSLGPGELISHYGTQKQKDHYLPRLADGREIPCFGLTEPEAGSDAGSITSTGVIFKGEDGQLYIRVNWDKRYITLAAVSTILGLAVKLKDPENLLGRGKELGITCVLIPADAKGVTLGKRHNPMGIAFYNCPTRGKDVVVSIDQIIGGAEWAGRGWQMLMECLAAGRSISLPAQYTGMAKLSAKTTTAYGSIRKQFGMPIVKFEGVEEKISRIVGLTYMQEAVRIFTCGAVDGGIKPAVISAIAKYNSTEVGRVLLNDAMDVLGGAAISRGPRNILAGPYIAAPIGITVEGANILTRTMIIFGQGAIRCHPYAYLEMKTVAENDLKGFDAAFWGHIGHIVRNSCRSVLLSLSRGRLASTPSGAGAAAKYYRKLAWVSASFSIMSDIAMGLLGGSLKFREKLTGRYADVLMWMYYVTAALRRFEAEGSKKEHEAILQWSMEYAFARIQEAFDGIFRNFDVPVPGLAFFFKRPLSFWSRLNRFATNPSDRLGFEIVKAASVPGAFRNALVEGLYEPKASDPTSLIESAFIESYACRDISKKVSQAVQKKILKKGPAEVLLKDAVAKSIITADEFTRLEKAEKQRLDAVLVDEFELKDYKTALLSA